LLLLLLLLFNLHKILSQVLSPFVVCAGFKFFKTRKFCNRNNNSAKFCSHF